MATSNMTAEEVKGHLLELCDRIFLPPYGRAFLYYNHAPNGASFMDVYTYVWLVSPTGPEDVYNDIMNNHGGDAALAKILSG